MASISKRTTNKGEPRYDVRSRVDGRPVEKTFRKRAEAEAFKRRVESAEVDGLAVDLRAIRRTVAAVAGEWLGSNPAKRDSTYGRDEIALRVHILPILGTRPIGRVQRRDVRSAVERWQGEMAPRSVGRTYGVLRAVFAFAVEEELIGRSPCVGIDLPKAEAVRRELPAPKDLAAIARALRPDLAPMLWLGAVLGLRWGEVAALRVRSIDLLRRTVTITETVTRDRRGRAQLGPPKSNAGERTLSAPSVLAELLAEHMRSAGLSVLAADALLFPGAEGGPRDYSTWRRKQWKPAVVAAGWPGLGFHDLRRCNATALIAGGVDLKTAQTRLGHSDPRLTLAIYAQATSEADRTAADGLGARLMSTHSPTSA